MLAVFETLLISFNNPKKFCLRGSFQIFFDFQISSKPGDLIVGCAEPPLGEVINLIQFLYSHLRHP